ncbi:DUF1329 domain-containing protein [Paraburkholderia dipogonis]|uniref:DUF1329 domain-containing protein n=1 Tax=Paraburkholderia dipogonis TaxID=1211383 RepID=A0A4Y8MJB2_9BURK|nr:DUF1329 domain-containing protein [Paraburkholderia dipogonis]TFE37527.1 DUF1329 domain-containing protein [Paraburkholderia dipogonis]
MKVSKVLSVISVALFGVAALSNCAQAQTAGAEKGASSDGLVPAFSGIQPPPAGWSYGKVREQFWAHKDEKPLYTVTSGNVDKYVASLSPGQVELFKTRPGYRMDVYPSHRECGFPEWMQANMKTNASNATLDKNGEYLQSATLPGLPFPDPKNGAQAIWNHLMRYRGVGMSWQKMITAVSPRPGSSQWIIAESKDSVYYPWGKKGATPADKVDMQYGLFSQYNTPAALAGQGLVQRYYFDKPNDTYYYFTGQRRVRRMPSYSYDAPQIGFENEYTIDETSLFTGGLDRFNWKLVGKKELIVPYNNFGMYNFAAKYEAVFKPEGVDPGSRRYEMHRVFIVEATLKPDARHLAVKKVFYIDEDSGLILAGEDYDAQGKLWKVKEGYSIPVWELGGTCDTEAFVQYDIANGRYVSDVSTIGSGSDTHWFAESDDPKFKDDFYTSDNLKNISER